MKENVDGFANCNAVDCKQLKTMLVSVYHHLKLGFTSLAVRSSGLLARDDNPGRPRKRDSTGRGIRAAPQKSKTCQESSEGAQDCDQQPHAHSQGQEGAASSRGMAALQPSRRPLHPAPGPAAGAATAARHSAVERAATARDQAAHRSASADEPCWQLEQASITALVHAIAGSQLAGRLAELVLDATAALPEEVLTALASLPRLAALSAHLPGVLPHPGRLAFLATMPGAAAQVHHSSSPALPPGLTSLHLSCNTTWAVLDCSRLAAATRLQRLSLDGQVLLQHVEALAALSQLQHLQLSEHCAQPPSPLKPQQCWALLASLTALQSADMPPMAVTSAQVASTRAADAPGCSLA